MKEDCGLARAWVALGSNLGDRRANLEGALETLRAACGVRVLRVSPWIETAPEGGPPGQPGYLNGVCELSSELSPTELLELLLTVERDFGRRRRGVPRNGPRTLDLDLLLWGDEQLETPELSLPHPRLEERIFVLEPLSRLAPDLVLARSRKTVRERLAELIAER